REMFGTAAGLIAVSLLAFDPTLLAHGALVTTDSIQACFMFAAIYAFYRYVKAPSPGRLVITGLAVGLALASKHSAVLLLPMLLIVAAVDTFRANPSSTPDAPPALHKRALAHLAALFMICAI